MTVLVDFSIPVGSSPLGRALETAEEMEIDIKTCVPIGEEYIPFLWAEGSDFEAFEAQVKTDPSVDDFVLVEQLDGRALYRIEWRASAHGVIDGIRDAKAELMQARRRETTWQFRALFPDHGRLGQFHSYCQQHALPVQIDRIDGMADSFDGDRVLDLTAPQEEALALAVACGYFSIPREISATELGNELGISDHAVIERLRRGITTLVNAAGLEPPIHREWTP
jgi:predicted DNA binding protein